jgi:hypothetical protein
MGRSFHDAGGDSWENSQKASGDDGETPKRKLASDLCKSKL